jgi:hypothetical protein
MTNTKAAPRIPQAPLADGQVWQMAELNLQVGMVGKLLVHYKLAKPNAVRIPNLVGSIATIKKFLKKNKAVLLPPVPVAPVVVKKKPAAKKKPVVAKTKSVAAKKK